MIFINMSYDQGGLIKAMPLLCELWHIVSLRYIIRDIFYSTRNSNFISQ